MLQKSSTVLNIIGYGVNIKNFEFNIKIGV